MIVRTRRPADLDGCVVALRAAHDADRYPLNWPADPPGWLDPPGLQVAWVAEDPAGVIAGHVALVGDGPDVELSRFYVTPAARRRGIATALLAPAVAWAAEHGVGLTLNVVVDGQRSAATAFYEASGFQHTHDTPADWSGPDGRPVTLRHYTYRSPR